MLTVTIDLNGRVIRKVSATRLSHVAAKKNRYETSDDRTLLHLYANGAEKLAMLLLKPYAEEIANERSHKRKRLQNAKNVPEEKNILR